MTIRTARLTAAVLATIALLAIPARPAHAADPYLSITEAKTGARYAVEVTLSGFTETTPRITIRCRKTGRATASCHATFSSDRLSGSVSAKVRDQGRELNIWLRDLRVTGTGPYPSTTSPSRGIS